MLIGDNMDFYSMVLLIFRKGCGVSDALATILICTMIFRFARLNRGSVSEFRFLA